MPGSFITSSTLRGSADYTEASTSTGWNRAGDKSQKAENSPFYYGSGKKNICQDLKQEILKLNFSVESLEPNSANKI